VDGMELSEVERLVGELDAGVPREGAVVSLQKYGDDLDEAFVVANRRGYLRLGVEFLKAAFAPHVPPEKTLGERPHAIYVDLDYLIAEDSGVRFDYFERNEGVTVRTHHESLSDRLIPVAVIGAVVSILVLALVGLVTVVKALL
jgi:hypothetical protein